MFGVGLGEGRDEVAELLEDGGDVVRGELINGLLAAFRDLSGRCCIWAVAG